MTTSATLPARVADIVGPENVLTTPLAQHEIGGITPSAAVRPHSAAQIAEIVRFASAEKLAVIPAGGRTKIDMGALPRRYDLALDMTGLDRVLAFDPGDMTLSVDPGIPLLRLQDLLAEHRQFLPLIVPFANRATAGGTVSSGLDSPLRQFYGTARDFVLGLEFVTGDGVRAKSGGCVVKNVSGYDLHKLMIGALGTLGVVTKINFRTFPLPAATRALVVTFHGVTEAVGLRHAIARSALRPLVVEIVSQSAAEFIGQGLPSDRAWSLVASFGGPAETLERSSRDLQRMAEQGGAVEVSPIEEERLFAAPRRTCEFIPAVLRSSSAATILKLGVLPGSIEAVLKLATTAAEGESLGWAALARGLGVIYFALLPGERSDDSLARVARATNAIFSRSAALAANVTIPWCPAEWKGALPIWGPERSDLSYMRSLKNVFDPRGTLAPGRFMGGI